MSRYGTHSSLKRNADGEVLLQLCTNARVEYLPSETMTKIFGYLDLVSLLSAQCVCQKWKCFAATVWSKTKRINLVDFAAQVKQMEKNNKSQAADNLVFATGDEAGIVGDALTFAVSAARRYDAQISPVSFDYYRNYVQALFRSCSDFLEVLTCSEVLFSVVDFNIGKSGPACANLFASSVVWPNVTVLHLVGVLIRIRSAYVGDHSLVFSSFPKLEEFVLLHCLVSLENTLGGSQFTNHVLQSLSSSVLRICTDCQCFWDVEFMHFFGKLKSLRCLCLTGLQGFSSDCNRLEWLQNFAAVESLSELLLDCRGFLSTNYSHTRYFLQTLARSCPNLRFAGFTNYRGYINKGLLEIVQKLPLLKALLLYDCFREADVAVTAFSEIAELCVQKLKLLHVFTNDVLCQHIAPSYRDTLVFDLNPLVMREVSLLKWQYQFYKPESVTSFRLTKDCAEVAEQYWVLRMLNQFD